MTPRLHLEVQAFAVNHAGWRGVLHHTSGTFSCRVVGYATGDLIVELEKSAMPLPMTWTDLTAGLDNLVAARRHNHSPLRYTGVSEVHDLSPA